MAYSFDTYVGDGSTTQFAVTFGYIQKSDITVYEDGVSVSFTWDNDAQINCAVAPVNDAVVTIVRTTNRAARLVDYTNASILDEDTLDKDSNQLFYVTQEAFDELLNAMALDTSDNTYDANSRRIKNVANAVNDQDATPKAQVISLTASQVAACNAAQAAAEAAQAAAETAETNAETAETNAETAQAKAEDWAEEVEDTEVETGRYSALHHSAKAQDAQVAAETAQAAAETAETNAETAQTAAETAETNAEAAVPTISDSAPSGGSDGDIWYEY
jgi:hypothetical protein